MAQAIFWLVKTQVIIILRLQILGELNAFYAAVSSPGITLFLRILKQFVRFFSFALV